MSSPSRRSRSKSPQPMDYEDARHMDEEEHDREGRLDRSYEKKREYSRSPSPSDLKTHRRSRRSESPRRERRENSPPREFAVYISDIARGTTEQMIKEELEKVARIYKVSLVRNKVTGETRGYGFVRLYNKEDVYKILDMEHPPQFRDKVTGRLATIKITVADPKNVLYVGNLPRDVDEEQLKREINELTKRYNESNLNLEATKFEFVTSADTGRLKGYAWVHYENHDVAIVALKILQRYPLRGHHLNASFAEPRAYDERKLETVKTLYVKNVAPNITEQQLLELFGGEDLIERVSIPLDKVRGKPLGHAFIHFKERAAAQEAMDRLQDHELEERKLHIEWSVPPSIKAKPPAKGPRGAHPPPPYAYGGRDMYSRGGYDMYPRGGDYYYSSRDYYRDYAAPAPYRGGAGGYPMGGGRYEADRGARGAPSAVAAAAQTYPQWDAMAYWSAYYEGYGMHQARGSYPMQGSRNFYPTPPPPPPDYATRGAVPSSGAGGSSRRSPSPGRKLATTKRGEYRHRPY